MVTVHALNGVYTPVNTNQKRGGCYCKVVYVGRFV